MATVLTYHHVADASPGGEAANLFVSPRDFEEQLRHLARAGYEFLSPDALRSALRDGKTPVGRTAVITFDDGYEDNHRLALPILRRQGGAATFFITTGRIGAPGHMSEGQLRELDAAGMTIGSHTVTHPWLARIPLDEARRELAESKATLEAILGKPVRWLCYPSGSFNPQVAHLAQELGYVGAFSVIRDNRVRAEQLYYLPRVMVMNGASMLRFRYYLSDLYHWVHARKNRRRWGRYL